MVQSNNAFETFSIYTKILKCLSRSQNLLSLLKDHAEGGKYPPYTEKPPMKLTGGHDIV